MLNLVLFKKKVQREVLFTIESPAASTVSGRRGFSWDSLIVSDGSQL